MAVSNCLARLQLADLLLDTAPDNAHTAASDALCAGVPVLTWAGDTFAARVAGSLLHAVGLPELVMHGLAGYADLAMALATDAPRLAAQRASAPLFDVPAYTLALERLFDAMWQRHSHACRHRPWAPPATPVCAEGGQARRRRATKPTPIRPASISAKVSGSGTAEVWNTATPEAELRLAASAKLSRLAPALNL